MEKSSDGNVQIYLELYKMIAKKLARSPLTGVGELLHSNVKKGPAVLYGVVLLFLILHTLLSSGRYQGSLAALSSPPPRTNINVSSEGGFKVPPDI